MQMKFTADEVKVILKRHVMDEWGIAEDSINYASCLVNGGVLSDDHLEFIVDVKTNERLGGPYLG